MSNRRLYLDPALPGDMDPNLRKRLTELLREYAKQINKVALSAETITTSQVIESNFTIADATAGTVVCTLVPAVDMRDERFTIKKRNSNTNPILIAPQSGEFIDDGGTKTLTTQFSTVTVVSDGDRWWRVGLDTSVGGGSGTAAMPPIVWRASQGIGAATNFASFTQFTGTGDTDGHVYLVANYDQSTDEHLDFLGFLPATYAGGGLTVKLYWSSNQTTGAVVWNTAFKSITDDADDLDTKAFATAQAATATTASAAGEVDYVSIAHTNGAQIDSTAAGEMFFLRVTRDANNASDTLADDAELHLVTIEET